MSRIGIYGGTFNPPHLGHVRAAQYALTELKLDRLLVIPDRIMPHKQLPPGSPSAEQRMEMVRLAFGGSDSRICVSELSMDREGPNYAYETVELVRQMEPDAELFLLMGSDMFASFDAWREPERILRCAALGVMSRGDREETETIAKAKEKLEGLGAKTAVISNPVTAISSTDLRRMLVFRCASEFIPEPVLCYIRQNGLYGTDKDLQSLTIDQLERTVVSLLKPNRVAHVLGCRQAAVELALRYGADETDAARAALLHDITKALDGPLQLTLCREYGIVLDTFSSHNPKTLHALTGSLVAERIFGENPAVVSAICSHTTGKPNMNLLEKIIYVADYMEPNRDFPGVEQLRQLAAEDITKALKKGLEMTLEVLKSQNREISPESAEALRWLNCQCV